MRLVLLWTVLAVAEAAPGIPKQAASIPMRDGIVLAADLYNVRAGIRGPSLLIRTPYDKDTVQKQAERYAQGGYTVIVQDCRGRYASKGDYTPYNNDRQDGYDTIEWIGRQPWSNGKVGMFGGSHTGLVQYLAMADGAPGLTVIAPAFTSSSLYRVAYREGVLRLALISTGGVRANPPPPPAPLPGLDLLHHTLPLMHVPLAGLQDAYGWKLPWMTSLLSHPEFDGFWRQTSAEAEIAESTVPVQLVTGYYDFFHHDTIQDFFRLVKRRSGAPVQLILGPWTHGGTGKSKVQDVSFGDRAEVDVVALNLAWFDRFLKEGPASPAAVRYFVLGDNEWNESSAWPPPEAATKSLYLGGGGQARFQAPSAGEQSTEFISDPDNPVPSVPAHRTDVSRAALWSPLDYSQVSARKDVVTFTTQPFSQPVRIAGPIQARLYVQADTPSTDWAIRLFAVPVKGLPLPLAQGITREKRRAGDRHAVLVDVGSVAVHLKPGERLRVEIAGSNFPMYDRNLHTGEGPFSANTSIARQRIYHSSQAASALLLPVIPDSKHPGSGHKPARDLN